MMKTSKLKLSIFFLIIFLGVSCSEDYLNKLPVDSPSSASFPSNQDELVAAINGCYNNFWDANGSWDAYKPPLMIGMDLGSDISYYRGDAKIIPLETGAIDPTNDYLRRLWVHCYKGIARSNYFIENAERAKSVTETALYNRAIGEALFLRSLYYVWLTSAFGDVPLIIESVSLEESQLARTPKAEIFAKLYTDLDLAAASLSITNTGNNKGRATKGAAMGLKARAALYNGDWDTAISASQAVMAMGYTLDNNYAALFTKLGQDASKEILFLINYKAPYFTHATPNGWNSRMGGGFAISSPTMDMVDSYLCTDGLPIDESPIYNPLKPFINRDPRLDMSIAVPGSVFQGYQYETHRDSLYCTNYNVNPPKRVANNDAISAYASFTGYNWRKWTYMDNPNWLKQSENGFIVIRYAEVLLTYAEAKIEKNEIDQTVYDAINLLRKRSSVNMPLVATGKTQAQLRSIVRIERKCELALESGLRLADIRRWRIAEKAMSLPLYGRVQRGYPLSAPQIDENGIADYSLVPNKADLRVVEVRTFDKNKHYLWPIPQTEIDVNKNLEQNPGY